MNQEFSKLTVDSIKDSIKGDRLQAQLRQSVVTHYPNDGNNSMNDGLFEEDETSTYNEKRVCWIDAPNGTTKEQVEERISKFPNPRIYKVLSQEPILTEEQENAVEKGLTTKDEIAERQMVRDSEKEPILYDDKPQYRSLHFSLDGAEDIDKRSPIEESTGDDVKDVSS